MLNKLNERVFDFMTPSGHECQCSRCRNYAKAEGTKELYSYLEEEGWGINDTTGELLCFDCNVEGDPCEK